jgi:hypothetical protein
VVTVFVFELFGEQFDETEGLHLDIWEGISDLCLGRRKVTESRAEQSRAEQSRAESGGREGGKRPGDTKSHR